MAWYGARAAMLLLGLNSFQLFFAYTCFPTDNVFLAPRACSTVFVVVAALDAAVLVSANTTGTVRTHKLYVVNPASRESIVLAVMRIEHSGKRTAGGKNTLSESKFSIFFF